MSCAVMAGTHGRFINERHVYVRGETAELKIEISEVDAVTCHVDGLLVRDFEVAGLSAVTYPIDTALLRSGDYVACAVLKKGGKVTEKCRFPFAVGKPHDTERMPVWNWCEYKSRDEDLQWWIDRGFTGGYAFCDWAREIDSAEMEQDLVGWFLEEAARHDFDAGAYFHPLFSKALKSNEALLARSPCGKQYDKLYPLEKPVLEHSQKVAANWMARFADYPAFRHVLFSSEYYTPFCANRTVADLAEKQLGLDVTDFVGESPWDLKPLPVGQIRNGLTRDDNPHYLFRKWWWEYGNGISSLNLKMRDIVKKHRPDIITWTDPYRYAPVRHRARGLDCVDAGCASHFP